MTSLRGRGRQGARGERIFVVIGFALMQKGEPMTNSEAINWIINISADIGKAEHRDLWHYEQALSEIREMLESEQSDIPHTNVGDTISRQSAIDEIARWIGYLDDDMIGRIQFSLKRLPSAQSEDAEKDIRAMCGECDAWNIYKNYPQNYSNSHCFPVVEGLPSAQPETCEGCKHLGKWENEVEYGYPSPCTSCKRRVEDHYEG